jgi:multisubunit Na+/H+ antiporter MnhB subunit
MTWAFIGLAVAWFAALIFWGRADENLNKPVAGRVPDKLDKPFRSKVLREHGQKAMPIFWLLWVGVVVAVLVFAFSEGGS